MWSPGPVSRGGTLFPDIFRIDIAQVSALVREEKFSLI